MATEPDDNQLLRTRILAIGTLVITALVGSAVYDAWRLHEQLQLTNHRALGNLARALANEARRNFESVDLLLKDTADWYENAAATLSPAQIQMGLSARASGVSQVSVLTLVDAQGQQRVRSRDTGEPMANVADRPYFVAQREIRFGGQFINEPIITRSERRPALVISRRLDAANGSFDGVVTASMTLVEFQEMYATLELNEGSSLVLALEDGTVVARLPQVAAMEGNVKRPELALFKGGDIIDRAISPVDGRAKLIAALPVGNQPLIIAVIRDEQQSLSPWYDEVLSAAVRTLLLSLLIIFTIHRLLRQLKRVALGEQALRESEERYAMTMDAADGGHAEWNIVGDSFFLSPKWRAVHALPAHVAIANLPELVAAVPLHDDDRTMVRQAVELHLAGKSPAVEIEYRVLHADPGTGPRWRWVHARAKRLLDDRGTPIRLFCAATEVTERREAMVAKLELERRLQQTQRLESLGTLAGGIAHDFNNILGAILGFGEMAQQKAKPGSDLHRHLARVMQAGDRARLLVRRILDFSRSGVAECAPVHIQSVVEEVVAMLLPSLPPGIVLNSELQAGDLAVMGDATQLYQVVINLCTNAVQAMGQSGVLTVRLQPRQVTAARTLLDGCLVEGSYACLEVEDTGSGIEPAVLQSMFNPFFTTKKGGEGTGLGLSVVHGVVADHGGAIDVVSQPGTGTTLSVWLPTQGNCEPRCGKTPATLQQGNGQTVMVVDDEVALVELAEELLASLGYEPVGFSTAEAALAAFEADPGRFDAVLTDEMLPGMAGSVLAARLRALHGAVPIILMSGKITAEVEARVATVGMVALLHKPLQLSEIADALTRAWAYKTGAADVTFTKQA
ncbi:MAG: hypothetical protein JWP29_1311 [Rhodoferax sp.]|nr:hypothetical protein [Rhodoferax sp.]